METLWGADERPSDDRPTVVTVGMFDGVHRGHRLLFDRVFDDAKKLGARSAVVTFDPHPLEVLAPDKAPCMLTTLDQRLKLFEDVGFDIALVLPFNKELSLLTPHEFAKEALVEELHVRKILVGEDFRFGHDRAGDVVTLRDIGKSDGFEAEAIGLLGDEEGKRVSSTDIRRLVAQGDVEGAAALLGHPFKLAGTVVEGDRRGRSLGFPTANLAPHPRACLPGNGVYSGWWVWAGRRLPGAINVGVRPTFKADAQRLCEIYVLDFEGDLYGQEGEVEFLAFLRPEEKFSDADSLIHQMERDIARSREILGPA
ncbi:MAG: bifunctional riboflavin kinase/FAD synthetase [Actinomycetota bacterium]